MFRPTPEHRAVVLALYRRCLRAARNIPNDEHRLTWHTYTQNGFRAGELLRDRRRIELQMADAVSQVDWMEYLHRVQAAKEAGHAEIPKLTKQRESSTAAAAAAKADSNSEVDDQPRKQQRQQQEETTATISMGTSPRHRPMQSLQGLQGFSLSSDGVIDLEIAESASAALMNPMDLKDTTAGPIANTTDPTDVKGFTLGPDGSLVIDGLDEAQASAPPSGPSVPGTSPIASATALPTKVLPAPGTLGEAEICAWLQTMRISSAQASVCE